MKIEIDISDVESLRQHNAQLTGQVKRLQEELRSLDPEKRREESVRLAKKLFVAYMKEAMKQIGFDGDAITIDTDGLEYVSGDGHFFNSWPNVKASATVSDALTHAYIRMGLESIGTKGGRIELNDEEKP